MAYILLENRLQAVCFKQKFAKNTHSLIKSRVKHSLFAYNIAIFVLWVTHYA